MITDESGYTSGFETYPSPQPQMVGRIAELEAQNERLREALEVIADTDIKPFRCAYIARDALAAAETIEFLEATATKEI